MDSTVRAQVIRFGPTERDVVTDHVIAESPFEMRLDGTPIAVLMRSPGHDADLALGFALTEGIVLRPAEIAHIRPVTGDDQGDRWVLELAEGVTVDPEQFRRNLYTSSSCGVCGKASIDAVRVAAPPPRDGPVVDRHMLFSLPGQMRVRQSGFTLTGGVHAAAAFTPSGELMALREDIGRHNAVDKLVGALAAEVWPLPDLILLVSGRVSFEMVQKAAVAGISVVCGVSAASSLAIELGRELGVTVVGFLRGEECNVYSGDQRIR
ncbi:MAG: formate dehydrogenase accessory sulfurtransferase FdhD [Acidimicrobiia bacterium]|nr:formate dehydrogenase accessory sulfurtransferase FdhD [Acidimicrobiia bacterium]